MNAANAASPAIKQALREHMKAARSALTPDETAARSAAVCRRLVHLLTADGAKSVALFSAIANEVDVRPLLSAILETGRRVVFPRMVKTPDGGNAGKETLDFCAVSRPDDLAPEPRFGIPEPKPECPVVSLAEVDVIVVPGLAFDRAGNRLGWGVGYYDKLLKTAKAKRVGVCYSLQLVDEVPHDALDEPMHAVVTDEETLLIRDEKARSLSPVSRLK